MSEFGKGMSSKGNGTCKVHKNKKAHWDLFIAMFLLLGMLISRTETGNTGI